MAGQAPREALRWLDGKPRLHELMERYPKVWSEAGMELVAALEGGRAQNMNELVGRARATTELWKCKIRKSHNNPKVIESALPYLIKSRMSVLAMDKCFFAAATGKATGKVRFNQINGFIIQKLLFSHHLTRKPVSLRWFRFWWRFVGQKRLLMPLVQPRGIYCFYSREVIAAIAQLIGARSCLEIAAGDGTLARFLTAAGVNIKATDDYSWKHAIEYPEVVEQLGAKQALEKYEPQVVICSWPPPANTFERDVFARKSVEFYMVIGSRYRFASGNWETYCSQTRFTVDCDPRLSSLVLPPELESAVLLFRRNGQPHSDPTAHLTDDTPPKQ